MRHIKRAHTTETPRQRLRSIEKALRHLRVARNFLRRAGAPKAADYAARTLKSAEGAERHALRRVWQERP